jgi:hypothetical protein
LAACHFFRNVMYSDKVAKFATTETRASGMVYLRAMERMRSVSQAEQMMSGSSRAVPKKDGREQKAEGDPHAFELTARQTDVGPNDVAGLRRMQDLDVARADVRAFDLGSGGMSLGGGGKGDVAWATGRMAQGGSFSKGRESDCGTGTRTVALGLPKPLPCVVDGLFDRSDTLGMVVDGVHFGPPDLPPWTWSGGGPLRTDLVAFEVAEDGRLELLDGIVLIVEQVRKVTYLMA